MPVITAKSAVISKTGKMALPKTENDRQVFHISQKLTFLTYISRI